ncbi:hypothetical protein DBV15_11980 [Temnothorax longispinosus]|uniref:Uncharacterized protein n=1 Tax=Temnothorax longispinosus TaxID=300112 RepID=A0A4S2K6A8_9HYME|nr:hypothetical protein DBV15_11980 [Temnothorax longispinosus]
MLLEHTYEAIIDAGVNPKELRGTRTSVITAISQSETRAHFSFQSPELARLPMTGNNISFMANTISYWLGVTGQSHSIDTACSSSSYAIVKGYEQIRSGNCDAAIIASARVLSSDGYCKPFDEEGAGYMRSDTVAVVYLQKAKNARRIYATLVHGKVNCDGFKEEGITFPSVEKQKILLDEFYKECMISPNKLSYMEAHATGTLAGDPVEVMSIDQTLCAKRNTPLLMGSADNISVKRIPCESIGKLYNAGLQPQIANLYPTVEFPVSRGTPMISPLIRWDHSENFLLVQFRTNKMTDKKENVVSISTIDEEFVYLTGHVVNEKNLFPATGYLFYIWEMIALLKKKEYINTPVVFEDVNFIRATVLSQQNEIELTFSIQEGSNRFEIMEGDNAIVTGTVRIPTNIENEKISANLAEYIDDEEEMNTKDIYKELRLRGYQYTGVFRGLKSASVTGSNGHIAWTSNWVAFMDSMLQMTILGRNSRSLYVPTRIRKLTIDPKYHIQIIQDYPIENRQFSVRRYKSLDAVISGGIEICGTVAIPISRRQKVVNTVLEEYKFVAHRDLGTMLLQDAIRMSMHIALECCNMINVKIIEFVDDSDKVVPEDLNSPLISEILNNLPQIRHHTKLVTTHEKFPNISLPDNVSTTEITKLSKDENCLIVLGFDILTKNSKKLYKQLLSLLMPQGFLLTLEESGAVYDYSSLKMYELDIILEKQINDKKLLLLRKSRNIVRNQRIVHVNNYEFSWVDELKSIMKVQNETGVDTEIILVSEEDFECGLLGFINCLQKEPGDEIIRSVFIQDDKAPTFSLQEPLYTKQLQLDLPINVIRSGNVWGSYRHFPLPSLESKLVQRAYVAQMVQGDMSTLCWAQSRMSRINHENLVNVIYTSVNFRDIMVATGRLNAETIAPFERGNDCFIGLEFVGFNTHKQRLMGLCSHGVCKEEEPLDAPLLAHPRYYCLEHKCYIILGGLGGFGLELADWLTLRGAKNLVLTSRTGITTGYQQSRVKLWRSYGVDVQIVTVDDNLKHEDCEFLLKFAEERAPVDAIFNLAVVLKDCTFQNQSPQTFEDSFKSKAWMTKKMDELSRTICPQLRHFVVFSSVSCGRGNAGQTNYGMANSVMERICEKRMEIGLHGLAIQWGAVSDVGVVADIQEKTKELVFGGTLQQQISSCLETLEVFLLQDRPVVSSMVVAEKAKIGGSMNIFETVAHIMGKQHFPLPSLEPKFVENSYVRQTVQGDLSTLCWAQKRMPSYNIKREDFVNVIYTPLNFKDIMLATGRITADSIRLFERSYIDSLIGLEFVGFDIHGRRIMGMCSNGMLLEHTYEAIIDAGVNPKELRGTRTYVIIGVSQSETRSYFTFKSAEFAGLSMAGNNVSFMANTISYWLGVTGQLHSIDTACSSSSYAMVKAYEQIRSGNCDAAIVASASLCLSPHIQYLFYYLGT